MAELETSPERIQEYLDRQMDLDLLRFITCGSVDDGKSTLIGRLLYDTKMVYQDQLDAIGAASVKSGTTDDNFDLALLTDGLQAEREQGITIDVAYRYFSTAKRKFIIADTPGHEQYTRNMATGASNCELVKSPHFGGLQSPLQSAPHLAQKPSEPARRPNSSIFRLYGPFFPLF